MNYIFNSDLYLKYINEQSDEKEIDDSKNTDSVPKKQNTQQSNTNELDGDNIEYEEVDFSEKKNHFQKFILYYKLKQLQYHLNDQKVIRTYTNKKDLVDFLKILDSFLMFYKNFDYKESSNISINILNAFKKLK